MPVVADSRCWTTDLYVVAGNLLPLNVAFCRSLAGLPPPVFPRGSMSERAELLRSGVTHLSRTSTKVVHDISSIGSNVGPAMRITVTGATGYTGRHITARLLAEGHQVQSITGHPGRPNPFGSQVPLYPFHFDDPDRLAATLSGSDALINTYWVRFPHGDRTYDQAVENTRTMFDAARKAGVGRVVHVSIAQADRSQLPYFLGKASLEAYLRDSGLSYAIIRPTVIYGGGRDVLLSNVAWCLRRFPLFLLPSGDYGIQPVHVDDLSAMAVAEAAGTENILIDAAGPETYRFRDLVTLIRDTLGVRSLVLPAPKTLVYAAGRVIGLFVGDVVLTRDEVAGLTAGLCVSGDPASGTTPTRLSEWLTAHKDTLGRVYASELQRHYQ